MATDKQSTNLTIMILLLTTVLFKATYRYSTNCACHFRKHMLKVPSIRIMFNVSICMQQLNNVDIQVTVRKLEKVNLGKTIPREAPHNTQNYAFCHLFRQICQLLVKHQPT